MARQNNDMESNDVQLNVKSLHPSTEDGKEEKEKRNPKTISITGLYQFADSIDVLLLVIGVFGAIVAGVVLPFIFIFFGDITDAFTQYDAVSQWGISILGNADKKLTDDVEAFAWKMCVCGVIMWISQYLLSAALNYSAERQVMRIRIEFLKALLRQEIGWYDTTTTSDFASKMTEDLNKMQDGMGEKLGTLIRFIITFLFSVIYPFTQNWKITLVVCSVLPLLIIFGGIMGVITFKFSKKESETYAAAGAIAEEVLASIRTVVAFGGEDKETEKYSIELKTAKTSGIMRGIFTGTSMGLMFGVIYGVYGIGLWYGVKMIFDEMQKDAFTNCTIRCNTTVSNNIVSDPSGLANCIDQFCREFPIGTITIALFAIIQGGMQIGQSATFAEAVNAARAAAFGIFSVIHRKSTIDSSSELGIKPRTLDGKISLNTVYFNYPARSESKILQGISLDIESGTTVALVGPSGCGKSTCTQLMQRFYDPDAGSVLIDNTDIKTLNIGWLRNRIGIVGQEPVLFDCTINENIRYAKPDATDDEIKKACMEANAYEFIQKLPEKLNTLVGEGGAQLSGGQKQRIAIARALVTDPKILLLDEATSALDTESEGIVQDALDKAHTGRTTVIVAHRLSTIRNADAIIVLDEGIVKEKGTHDELINLKGLYFNLIQKQVANKEDLEESDKEIDNDSITEAINDNITNDTNNHNNDKHKYERQMTKMSVKHLLLPEEAFGMGEVKRSRIILFKRLAGLNSPELLYIVIGCIAALAFGAGTPFFAILFGDVMRIFAYNPSQYDKAMEDATAYALAFGAVGLTFLISMGLQGWMFAISGERLIERLRKRMFQAMLNQEIGWFDLEKNNTGALCARLSTNAQAVSGATGMKVGQVLGGITTYIFATVLAIYYNWKLGLVASLFLPVIILGMMWQLNLMIGSMDLLTKALENASKTAVEAISNIRTIAGLGCEQTIVDQYSKALEEPRQNSKCEINIRALISGFANSNFFFAFAICFYYGVYLITHSEPDELHIWEVFKIAMAVLNGGAMIGIAFQGLVDFGKAFAAAEGIFEILDRKSKIDTNVSAGLRLNEIHGNVQITDGEFYYPTRRTVKILRKLTLSIVEGQKIALVGQSGCGKSTVIQLMQRFYDLDNGSLDIEEYDIKNLNVPLVRSRLGIVSQEPVLFNRSIAENIMYGDNSRDVSMEEVIDVAKKANIHDFVSTLQQGYDTNVGDKGTQLSGGQKQRVAIARALIRDPAILLLDEATSALDTESETIVQQALELAQEGRTSITIAHRLSTVVGSDKIYVIHKGQVAEYGTHSELLDRKGIYYKLWNKSVT